MRHCLKLSLLAAIAGISATTAAPDDLKLAVRGQQPTYSIVIAAEPLEPIALAVEDFRQHVQQITGVMLPVVKDDQPLPSAAIIVGDTRHGRQLLGKDYNLDSLDDDSFTLRVKAPHLLVIGKKRGAQYGLYELLERFGKCRWYASWHSVVPKADAFQVPASLDETQKPAFLMREPFWFDMFNTYQALRNKCNGNQMSLDEKHGGKIRFGAGLFVHTFNRLINPNEYFDEHPEYFSEIKGERKKDYSQLCLSNPDVLKIVTRKMLEAIRRDPTATMYSVSQNDWYNYCECKNCAEIVKQTGNQAGILIWFVNQVAEEVEKEFPNALIETLAYQYTREPPPNIKPRHNVVPRLCTIECDFARPIDQSDEPTNIKFINDIKGWAKMTDKMFIWDYTTNFGHYIGPFPNFKALQGNVKLFRDCHVIGVMEQGAYQGDHGDFAELKGWILAKLLWNPDVDVQALIDDFINGYYGPAAPYVKQYVDELHARVADPAVKLKLWTPMTSKIFSDDFLLRATDLFEKAEEAVKHDPILLHNVQKAAMTIYYARFERLPSEKIKYFWTDTALVPAKVTALRKELAEKILERFTCEHRIQIAESGTRHEAVLQNWKNASQGHEVFKIEKGELTAVATPTFDCIAGILRDKSGYNYLDGNAGGMAYYVDIRDQGRLFKPGQCDSEAIRATYSQRGHYHLNQAYFFQDGGLVVSAQISNLRDKQALDVKPNAKIALALNCQATVAYKFDDDATWKAYTPERFAINDIFAIKDDNLAKRRSLTIASPYSKRAVKILFPKQINFDEIKLQLDPVAGTVIFYALESISVQEKQIVDRTFVVQPIQQVDNLPPNRTLDKSTNPVFVQEDFAMTISRLGEWGEFAADPEAIDGSAAVMFGSHYEWCFDSRIDLDKLVPGIPYKFRIRVKVEKAKDKGDAFWAGIYDQAEKRGYGEIRPKVEDIKDGYQWYDVCTWTPKPENNQWLWAGPGIFDLKTETSAVKKVYIDRIELVPMK